MIYVYGYADLSNINRVEKRKKTNPISYLNYDHVDMLVAEIFFIHFLGVFSTTIKQFGKVDVLLNNAGIVDDVDWERTFQVNAVSLMSLIHIL